MVSRTAGHAGAAEEPRAQLGVRSQESQQRYTKRMLLVCMNTTSAILPILGYLAAPQQTSALEVAFDVLTHTVRAISFAFTKPSRLLKTAATVLDCLRLALIAKNSAMKTSTFPVGIQITDTAVHGLNLYCAHQMRLL